MMAAAGAAAANEARHCPHCRMEVVFMSEAFGCICSQCGIVIDETDTRWDASDGSFPQASSIVGTSRIPGWVELEAQRQLGPGRWNGWQSHSTSVDGVIVAILARFHQSNRKREVQVLLTQVNTLARSLHKEFEEGKKQGKAVLATGNISSQLRPSVDASAEGSNVVKEVMKLRGGQHAERMAVAASFSILKTHNDGVTLEDVCSAASVGTLDEIADCLRYMESLLGETPLLQVSREEPAMYIAAHLSFLKGQMQRRPGPRRGRSAAQAEMEGSDEQDGESVLAWEDHKLVSDARIGSSAFLDLTIDLCQLCSDNGLNNRSAKTSSRKDLSLCAWAIVMLAMEASSGRLCNEGRMARALALAPVTGTSDEDGDGMLDGRQHRPTLPTVEAMVKKRYVEITRMLSLYMEHLPWVSKELRGEAKKRPNRRSARDGIARIKQDVSSINPFPRSQVARCLKDVLRLRPFLEKALKGSQHASLQHSWSHFGSTEDFFHRIRASADGLRAMREDEKLLWRAATPPSSQIGVLKAVLALLQDEEPGGDQRSQLARSVGPELLQLETLEAMRNEVIDKLFFQEGEMESYLRDGDDVKIVHALRARSGDWDAATTSQARQKRDGPESEVDSMRTEGKARGLKRTKALSEAEAARLLAEL